MFNQQNRTQYFYYDPIDSPVIQTLTYNVNFTYITFGSFQNESNQLNLSLTNATIFFQNKSTDLVKLGYFDSKEITSFYSYLASQNYIIAATKNFDLLGGNDYQIAFSRRAHQFSYNQNNTPFDITNFITVNKTKSFGNCTVFSPIEEATKIRITNTTQNYSTISTNATVGFSGNCTLFNSTSGRLAYNGTAEFWFNTNALYYVYNNTLNAYRVKRNPNGYDLSMKIKVQNSSLSVEGNKTGFEHFLFDVTLDYWPTQNVVSALEFLS